MGLNQSAAEANLPMSLLLPADMGGSEGSSQGQLLQQLTFSPPYAFAPDSQEAPAFMVPVSMLTGSADRSRSI